MWEKSRYFRMRFNLNYYLFKSSRYNYGSTYMNPRITTNQKPKINEPYQNKMIIIKPQCEKQKR